LLFIVVVAFVVVVVVVMAAMEFRATGVVPASTLAVPATTASSPAVVYNHPYYPPHRQLQLCTCSTFQVPALTPLPSPLSPPPPPPGGPQVPDIIGYLIKAIVDTKYTALLLTTWVGLVVSWAAMRLYVYPVYIVSKSWEGLAQASEHDGLLPLAAFMILLLCTLQVLHVWWWCMFLWIM